VQIVAKESALLTPREEIPTYESQIPVDADHREMCRFESSKDKTYETFVRNIKQLLKSGDGKEMKNEYFVVPHKANQHFTGRNEIRQRLCDNLITDRHIRAKVQQRFVLYGLGGSGKTQVSLKFAQDHREQ